VISLKSSKVERRAVKKVVRIVVALAACFAMNLSVDVAAATQVAPGGPCKKAGQTWNFQNKPLVCRMSGARLRWVQVSIGRKPGVVSRAAKDTLADDYARFSKPLPRSLVDRPDDGGESSPKVKVIYAVPSFAKDQRRDVSGEIARGLFEVEEWRASQNGGFGLRYDTFNGALDIGYMTFESTKQQWYDRFYDIRPYPGFRNGLSYFHLELHRAGWWSGPLVTGTNDTAGIDALRRGDLYFVVFEAPAGAYGRTGAGEGGCRSMTDATNDSIPIIGWASIDDRGTECDQVDVAGRFDFAANGANQNRWVARKYGMIDHFHQYMRNLPGCSYPASPKDGERVKIPGVLDESKAWEIRGGFNRDLSEINDPNSARVAEGIAIGKPPMLDPRHDLYFHITSDKLAGAGVCNSDISKHPLWDNLPLDRDSGRTLLRSSYDRPDDISGPQFHAVYVVRNGAKDFMYDTSGDIERALRHADGWLRQETGKGMRLDTFQGKVDVTYLPLPPRFESKTGNDCSKLPCPNDQDFYAHLRSYGRVHPDKTYLFFYSGGLTDYVLCGGAGIGKSVLLNLEVDGKSCSGTDWTKSNATSLSWSLLALHETFHSLGAVCSSAPESDGAYHSSRADDIMNARAKGTVKLDPTRRNYWGSVPADCTDLSRSPLFSS
jgi:hypothetical protein